MRCQRLIWSAGEPNRQTLVAVDESILDYDSFAIQSCILSCLSLAVSKAHRLLAACGRGKSARQAEDMAGEEVFGCDKVGVRSLRLGISSGEKEFGRRHEKNLERVDVRPFER